MDEEIEKPIYKEKWGRATEAGFQLVPDVLFKYQQQLQLNCYDMLVLLNLSLHWWYKENKPFPRTLTIARRMGVTLRTVQRSIKKMVECGYIKRTTIKTATGDTHPAIDLDPLVKILEKLSASNINFTQLQQENKSHIREATKGTTSHLEEISSLKISNSNESQPDKVGALDEVENDIPF